MVPRSAKPTAGAVGHRLRFSGHETFPFRYAWLPKGLRAIEGDPSVFSREDAIVTLGVGKNMAQSIQHWCEVLSLIRPRRRADGYERTLLGTRLFGVHGWDPYLEDQGTLWLLHWLLVSYPELASTWSLAFTKWNAEVFSGEELEAWILSMVPHGRRASRNSIHRDVEVFLRTYVPRGNGSDGPLEDTFDCPLVELGLIEEEGNGIYRFVRGPKPALPDAIFSFAVVDYWTRFSASQKSMSFETVLHGEASPGAAFRLSESALSDLLERLPSESGVSFDETAGLRQLLLKRAVERLDPMAILEKHYEGR